MKMDEGLDTGAMAMIERMPIGADMTTGELHDALARLGADLMVRALGALERGTLQFTPQPADGVTYATKIDKAETRIDWAQAVAGRCTTTSAACRRFPAPGSRWPGDRVKVLRTHEGRGQRRARHGARRPSHRRLRRRRAAPRRVAERRQQADERRRIPARHARSAGLRARLSHAALQDHHRIRRHAVRRLAVAGQRAVGAARADRGDRSLHRRERRWCRAPAAPTPASTRSARSRISISSRSATTDTVRDALNAHLRPHPVAVLSAELVAGGFRRAQLGGAPALSLSHRQPPRPTWRSTAAAPGGCRARSMSRRCTRPRSGSSASTTSRPSAPPNARPSRR